MKSVFAAYVVAWAAHIVYLLTLHARQRELRRAANELEAALQGQPRR